MSYNSLLNQTVTIYPKTGYTAYGRERLDTSFTVLARLNNKSIIKLTPKGSTVTVDAIMHLPVGTAIANDDQVEFGSVRYKVLEVNPGIDGRGNTRILKVQLVKWQAQ